MVSLSQLSSLPPLPLLLVIYPHRLFTLDLLLHLLSHNFFNLFVVYIPKHFSDSSVHFFCTVVRHFIRSPLVCRFARRFCLVVVKVKISSRDIEPRDILRGNMSEDTVVCRVCLTSNQRKRARQCCSCGNHFHLSCVGLSRIQSNTFVNWTCPGCLEPTSVPPGVNSDIDLVRFISCCRNRVRVLRIIPKGAIICVADGLQKLLTQAIQEKTPLAWGRLLCFSYWGLRQPTRTPDAEGRSVSLATRVKRQVSAFLGTDSLEYPTDDFLNIGVRQGDPDRGLKRSVSAKFADGDIKGAVRLLASSEGHAPKNEETLRLLQQKHPPAPGDLSLPDPPGDEYPTNTVSGEDIRKALASFRPGSAGGPDGLRPGHLRALVSRKAAEAGVRLLNSLTEFSNLVLGGGVPDFAVGAFYGASLCALSKKDGGVRPIAVGNTLRRLATKVGARSMSASIGDSLRPVQLGFSTKGGCEAAAHAARRYLNGASHRRVIFKVDMANAFNSLRRDVFLAAAKQRAQGLYRLLWQAYSGPTTLFYGEENLVSATGIQQGDPFGPALFSLGIDEISRKLDVEFNVWYLDDGTIGGAPEKVISGVRGLIADLEKVGLEINQSKCELVVLNHTRGEESDTVGAFAGLIPGVKVVKGSEVSLLGAPLSEAGISNAVAEKQEDLERLTSRLELIENHQAFALLKSCFSLPKLQYILRASPAYRQEEPLSKFDETLVSALSSVTNVRLEGDSLVQAVLPVSQGGLGIRMSKDIALPAFISSLHSVRFLTEAILQNVQLAEDDEALAAVETWGVRSGGHALVDEVDRNLQATWDGPICQMALNGLLERADQVSRARLLAASRPESGLWLHAMPVSTLGTLLDPESLRVAIALRVGAAVCEPHACRCGSRMDARGLHGLSCRFSSGRHPRHAALNDVIKRALHSAGIPSVLEPLGIDRGDGRRPDGLTVFPFANGKCLCWDATCTDTFSRTHVNNSAVSPGHAACEAESLKRRKYASLVDRYRFEPVAVETSGVIGKSSGLLLDEIGRRMSEASGETRETFWLKQRLGLAVQRGNAYSILTAVRGRYDTVGDAGTSQIPAEHYESGWVPPSLARSEP